MNLKLVESAQPIRKLARNINSVVLPAFEKQGFEIDTSRTISSNKFSNTYKGRYYHKGNETGIPFWLDINTTSPAIDEYNDKNNFETKTDYRNMLKNNEFADIFITLNIGNQQIKIGPAKSNNYNQISDLIDKALPELNTKSLIGMDTDQEDKKEDTPEENTEEIEALKGAKAGILTSKHTEQATEELKDTKEENPETLKVNTDEVGKKIQELLSNYGVKVTYETATVGPAVTQYEFKVSPGVKINDVANLNKEIAMGLAVKSVSIGPVEGKSTVGVQVPNKEISIVSLDEVLEKSEKKGLSVALGKDLNGNAVNADILDMQHVLIGGSTGSGKSAGINSMLASLISSYPPDLVKLILIDPKKVELSAYKNVPHLAQPIITDPNDAADALQKVTEEMDKRYSIFNKVEVKNIKDYNNLVDAYNKQHPEKKLKYMPYLVIVIDELADLMMTAGKSVEHSIQRITQLARAAGIHMIVATQRPSADIVTGPIKTNIASRIAFATPSGTDSRVILDQGGAEKLLGKGDMLFKPTGASSPKRLQGTFVDDNQVAKIVNDAIEKYK